MNKLFNNKPIFVKCNPYQIFLVNRHEASSICINKSILDLVLIFVQLFFKNTSKLHDSSVQF